VLHIILAAQIAAIVILFFLSYYICIQRSSRQQTQLLLLTVSTIVLMIGYLLELTAENQQAAITGTMFSYVGKPFALLSSFLFVCTCCGVELKRKVKFGLLLYHGMFTVVVLTNPLHHLFYPTIAFDITRPYSPLILTHGPLYYAYLATTVAHLIVNTVLAARELKRCRTRQRRHQVILIFGMIFSGILGYMIFLTGVTKGYDSTMAGCFMGAICQLIIFFRYRLFDALTLAKDQALQDAASGMLVLDDQGTVVYMNAMMGNLIETGDFHSQVQALPEGNSLLRHGNRVYDAKRSIVVNHGRTFGETIELIDITDSYRYSERLEQDVENRTRQILHIQRTVIGSLANLVEARDDYTGSHIKKTGEYVRILAEELQNDPRFQDIVTDDFLTKLADVAPLHDIGKIAVSDAILRKPGKLSQTEFLEMQNHCAEGARVIENTMRGVETDDYVSMAEDVARYHHEWWNGKGYPEGLKGEDIPLSARIMAVADVYDALRSRRVYKEPFHAELARNIIAEDAGTHFDPAVVEAFQRAIDRIETAAM